MGIGSSIRNLEESIRNSPDKSEWIEKESGMEVGNPKNDTGGGA